MRMKSVKYLAYSTDTNNITGGQMYDANLIATISSLPGWKASRVAIGTGRFSDIWMSILRGIQKADADVIIFNSSKCVRFLPLLILLRLIWNKKVLVVHHHFIYHQFEGFKKAVYWFTERLFLHYATGIVVPSPYVYDRLSRFIPSNHLYLCEIPFEHECMFKANPRPGALTYTGTVEHRKGLTYLLRALLILQSNGVKYHLDIIGKEVNKDYVEILKNYVAEHHLNVDFKGFISKEEKEEILSVTDIFVFPSLLEGYGMVLVEAQTYGLPIVCFDNSAMPYTVHNGKNGILVPDRDVTKFAEALSELISDRELRQKLSRCALADSQTHANMASFRKSVAVMMERVWE